MRLAFKGFAVVAALAVLLLAAYGASAVLTDDGESLTARDYAARPPAESREIESAQASHHDDMAKLCAEHMKEMQPLMEGMMAEMMPGMMDEMMDDDMMDGMMR